MKTYVTYNGTRQCTSKMCQQIKGLDAEIARTQDMVQSIAKISSNGQAACVSTVRTKAGAELKVCVSI